METKEIREIAVRAGRIMLCSGAEIYRVEDTIARICNSYGAECECFVLPTGIFVTVYGDNIESMSMVKRIRERTVDLHRIELVNAFSRGLMNKPLQYEDALEALDDIEKPHDWHLAIRLLASGMIAFALTILFNGGWKEGLAATVISMLIYMINSKISDLGIFRFFEYFVSGIIVGAASLVAIWIFPALNVYKIIMGSIMILVPGVAITNGIKDALHGDITASLLRLAEAVYITVAVGAGVGFMLSAGLRWL